MNIKLAHSELNPSILLAYQKSTDSFMPIASIQSKEIREEVIKRVNAYSEMMDTILAFVRESKSDTDLVKKAVELLNRDKE